MTRALTLARDVARQDVQARFRVPWAGGCRTAAAPLILDRIAGEVPAPGGPPMEHAARISRAQAVAVPRPQLAANHEWLAAAVALGLLLLGLLAP